MINEEKTRDFIRRAKEIHGDKYNYDEVDYQGNNTKVKIFCNTCKEYFWQTPSNHLSGHGCKKCAIREKTKWNLEIFIEESKKIHGDAFSYELTEWKGYNNKLKVRCTKCGSIIERKPQNHLKGQGCEECYKNRLREEMSIKEDEFLRRSKEKFGDKFDYSKMNYVNMTTPITLICNKHGEFTIIPRAHLISDYGCYECGKEGCSSKNRKFDINDLELVAKLKSQLDEGKTYDELANSYGMSAHCLGQVARELGLSSHLTFDKLSAGERNTILALKELSIVELTTVNNERVYGIDGRIKDFIIPDFKFTYNNVFYWIEYNGRQHYEFSSMFHHGDPSDFKNQIIRDKNERDYCKNNNIILIEIPYIINTYDKIKDFLDKTILQGIDPSDLIDYKSLYK